MQNKHKDNMVPHNTSQFAYLTIWLSDYEEENKIMPEV